MLRIWSLTRQLTACGLLLYSLPVFSSEPLIFQLPKATQYNDRYRAVTPQKGIECKSIFTTTEAGEVVTIERIISFADKQFERRGWSSEFLVERIKLARDFPKSEYFYTKKGEEVVGVLAATYAEYGPGRAAAERLPMESSLHLHLDDLQRPTQSNGRGLITEMRTYAIDGQHPRETRSTLALGALQSVVKKYESYPELLNEHVIYTYGDEISLRLYGQMGFENLTQKWGKKPISHAGSQWWILGITPNKMRSLIEIEQSQFGHFAKSGGEILALPNNRTVQFLGHFDQIIENGVKIVQRVRYVKSETEIQDGLWVAPGSDLLFDSQGRLKSVSKLARPYVIPGTTVVAGAGKSISFYPETGRPREVEAAAQAVELAPNVWARAGEYIHFLPDGDYGRIGLDFYNPKIFGRNANHVARPRERQQMKSSYMGLQEIK